MPKVRESWTVLPHEPTDDRPTAALIAVADSLE
jgi:hypothetical protein